MASDWIEKFSSTRNRFQDKRGQGLVFSDDDVKFFQGSLNGLKLDLQILSTSPDGPSKPPASEIARREVLLTSINAQLERVVNEQYVSQNAQQKQHTQDNSSDSSSSSYSTSRLIPTWGGGSKITSNSNGGYKPVATSDNGLSMRVMEMHNMQGNLLADIDHGVSRLHDQALAMGDEAHLHERLLDNMETNVDFAIDELREQRERTDQLRETVGYTKLYIILVVEVVILLWLLIMLA
jgi:hypothetical protein